MNRAKSVKQIASSVNWYLENRPLYEQLSKKVESIIEELIADQKIQIHAIYSRAKEINSFAKKIEAAKYTNPTSQITDLSGIRIIAYVENDLDKISKLIESNFDIDPKNSIDKSESLGTDKVGYRSIHFIAKLPIDRVKLPEYKKFTDLYFEIQIRTILQHAWAEIEHDKNYKFSGELPSYLKRRFKVLAGVLELADREFNQIAFEIDRYSNSVFESTKKGDLEISIDSTSLKAFLEVKFQDLIKKGMKPQFYNEANEKNVLEELREFGIDTLKKLDEIIPSDFSINAIKTENFDQDSDYCMNFSALLRYIMLAHNSEKFFKNCWKSRWGGIQKSTVAFIKLYDKNIEAFLKENKINIRILEE